MRTKLALSLAALLAASAIGSAAVVGAVAEEETPTATCTSSPKVSDVEAGSRITVVCTVPKPAPVTVTETVTASPQPSVEPSPSGSASPSKEPSVDPTPTGPTTTPTQPASGFPSEATTGWRHTGVALRTVRAGDSGPGWSAETVGGSPVFYVRTPGTVIDGLDIPMCVKVMANNVTIKRSRISCASYYTVNVSDPPTYYSGLTLTDVEIDGRGSLEVPGIAVMASSGATFTRLDVHGFGSSGPRLASGTTLRDSYIHGFVCAPGEHSAGTSANDGGSNIAITGNNIDISTGKDGCASAAASIYPDFGSYNGVTITGNRLAGGAYCLYTAQNTGKAVNVRVEGNTFARSYYPRCGQYGPAAQVASGNGNTFVGNVFDDGTPIP